MARKDTRYTGTRTSIRQVADAANIYGVKHFRFPIDVVNHENKLEDAGQFEEVHHRMTCRHCKRFQDPKHIADHHEQQSMTLFPDEGSE